MTEFYGGDRVYCKRMPLRLDDVTGIGGRYVEVTWDDGYIEGNTHDGHCLRKIKEASTINRPSHYVAPNGIELFDVIGHLSYARGNAIKYVFRAGRKSSDTELEDLRKAVRVLELEIKRCGG